MATVAISVRVPEAELEELDRRAKAHGTSRTAFLLGAALSDGLAKTAEQERLDRIEKRLARVEAMTFG
jgi:uncharacterized protein (DUF1778 family)